MAYPNGRVPLHLLVHLGGQIYLPPGTAARWQWFVREGKRRFGVTFRITPASSRGWDGWNGYRPYDIQVTYKKEFGNMAASAGYSSHGGWYLGQEVFAIDVDNWASVPWADFARLANEAGFRVDFVTPRERWHIGDFNNPWVIPAFAQEKPATTPQIPMEEDEMLMLKIKDGKGFHLCSLGHGVFRHFVATDPHEWIKNVARADDKWVEVNMVDLPALLWTYGCDLRIWDVREGNFVVLNPLDGSVRPGNMWSATNAARSAIATVDLVSRQTADYLKNNPVS